MAYDEYNNLINIKTINQDINFVRNNGTIKAVNLNKNNLFSIEERENGVNEKYSNGNEVSRWSDDAYSYNVSYDGKHKFTYALDDSSNINYIFNEENHEKILYSYDDNLNLIEKNTKNGRIKKENNYLIDTTFGESLSYEYLDGNTLINYKGIETLLKKDETDEKISLITEQGVLYEFFSNGTYSNFSTYTNAIGEIEQYIYNDLGYLEYILKPKNDNVRYYYDDLGRLISKEEGNNFVDYCYDFSNNLLLEEANDYFFKYSYNNISNPNQVTAINDDKLVYDNSGNLLEYKNNNLVWERGSLLKSFINNDKVVSYEYDLEGFRTKKIVDNEVSSFEYFNGLLRSSNNSFGTTKYIYDDEGNALAFTFRDNIYFYIKDNLNVIRGIVDEKLEPIITYEYDDWGIPKISYSKNDLILKANLLLYKDYSYDFETGMYYLGSRYYLPNIRRFISHDSLNKIANLESKDYSYNLYTYCNNNPINLADLFGFSFTVASSLFIVLFATAIFIFSIASLANLINMETIANFKGDNPLPVLEKSKYDFYNFIEEMKKTVQIAYKSYLLVMWMWRINNGKPERHHIIPQGSMKCAISRRTLTEEYNIPIDHNRNIIFLKYRFHKHLHTNLYYFFVEEYTLIGKKYAKKLGFLFHLFQIKRLLHWCNKQLVF